MPRRFSVNVRAWIYRFLVLRDGEQCAHCFEIPTTQNALEVDHRDGDPWNNDPDNLRLLCKSCNVSLGNKARVPTAQNSLPSDMSERERKEGKASTRVVRQAVNYSQGEATMQANFLFELDFRKWLLSQVQEKGFITRQDATEAGAELVGCSPLTTARYLAKLTSSAGPLQEVKDMLGARVLTWKNGHKPEPTIKIDLDKGEKVPYQIPNTRTGVL